MQLFQPLLVYYFEISPDWTVKTIFLVENQYPFYTPGTC